jgi:ribulose 1,5-bisphosphate carboxylase large subunit-like protein
VIGVEPTRPGFNVKIAESPAAHTVDTRQHMADDYSTFSPRHAELCARSDVDDSHVIARYRFKFRDTQNRTFYEMVWHTAVVTSLSGEACLPYEDQAARRAVVAKIVSQHPTGGAAEGETTEGIAEIAFPAALYGGGEDLPLLLSTLQYISVYDFVDEIELLDVSFPPSLLRSFKGPKYGLEGLLKLVGKRSAPLFGLILKPRQGIDCHQAASLAYEAALGGIDYVIDDELLVDPVGCRFANRVEAVAAAIRRAREESGSKTCFVANVTAGRAKAFRLAKIAEAEGVQGLMVNPITMGFDLVRELAQRRQSQTFIVANTVGRGILTNSKVSRISEELVCTLARLCGADAVYGGPFAGALKVQKNTLFGIADELRKKVGNIRPSCAVVSGGIGLNNLLDNAMIYGGNLMIQMGNTLCRLHDEHGGLRRGVETIMYVCDLYRELGSAEAYSKLLSESKKNKHLDESLQRLGWKDTLLHVTQRP